tara:strand:+ start:1191 stop:1586 length:396 start_codon:yes stop_codon:yes gene_type:complete
MRVNISYSVDLDEIPKKVLEFLEDVDNSIQETREALEASVGAMGTKNYTVAIEELAQLRNMVAQIDYRLDDCIHILSGYSKTLVDLSTAAKAEEGEKTQVNEEAMQAWVEGQLKNLQEKKDELNANDKESG